MVDEVIDRVNLLISVQGSRKVSMQNLAFMFEKYELTAEERQQVYDYCKKYGIALFDEDADAAVNERRQKAAEAAERAAAEHEAAKEIQTDKAADKKKGGFFSRLFGK